MKYKGALEQMNDIKNGRDREMTQEEYKEFCLLGRAYNSVANTEPMVDCLFRDTYNSLLERRIICEEVGISIELDYDI